MSMSYQFPQRNVFLMTSFTMSQWMADFCHTTREEINQNLKDPMLHYLIDLMDDANDFSWFAAKASHAALLYSM